MKPFICAFLSLTALWGGNCLSFPIEPVTLRELITASDVIVYARVEPSPKKPKKQEVEFIFPETKSPARLRVLSTLKGNPSGSFVEVHFNPNVVCPSPPRFSVNSNVMAFLQRNKESKGYRTVALSYGAITVDAEEAREYSTRINEMLVIAQESELNLRTQKTTEWLVKCVEGKVARWDGAADLTDRIGYLGQTNTSDYAKYLTAQQINRMSNTLFQADYIASGDLALVYFFKNRCQPEIISFLCTYLKKASVPVLPITDLGRDSLPEPWNVYDVMVLLAELTDSSEAKAMMTESVRTDLFGTQERIKLIEKFLPIIEATVANHSHLKPSSLTRP